MQRNTPLKFETVIIAFLRLMHYVENSDLVSNYKIESEITNDGYKLFYLPILRLSLLWNNVKNNNDFSISNHLSEIKKDANAVWYAIDCRNDIPHGIPKSTIKIDKETKNTLFLYLDIPLNTQLNIYTIHDIAGKIEVLIDDSIK